MRRTVAGMTLAFGLLASVIGCGEPMGAVTGTVKVDGKPTPGIQVEYFSASGEGGSAMGTTDESGVYTLHYPGGKTGAPPGEYIVRLSGVEMDGAPTVQVPARFGAESEIKKTVEAGTNVIDIDIESK